jgi:hypothetical protein
MGSSNEGSWVVFVGASNFTILAKSSVVLGTV